MVKSSHRFSSASIEKHKRAVCTLTLRMNEYRSGKSGGHEMKVMCLAPQDPANIRACLR